MNYKPVKLEEVVELHMSGRKAFVVFGVQTKDLEEYINNCEITLHNYGFDLNKLIIPKVVNVGKYKNIFFFLRHHVDLTVEETQNCKEWAKNMGNVASSVDFFNNNYGTSAEETNRKIFESRLRKFKFVHVKGLDLASNTECSITIELNMLDNKVPRIHINGIDYLPKLVGYMYSVNKVFVHELSFTCELGKDEGRIDVKIEPTSTCIKDSYKIYN
jgi:hypothetical protein